MHFGAKFPLPPNRVISNLIIISSSSRRSSSWYQNENILRMLSFACVHSPDFPKSFYFFLEHLLQGLYGV